MNDYVNYLNWIDHISGGGGLTFINSWRDSKHFKLSYLIPAIYFRAANLSHISITFEVMEKEGRLAAGYRGVALLGKPFD